MRFPLLIGAATVLVAGCGGASTPAVTPGPSAADPACTSLLQRLPPTLAGHDRADSPARGAAAWGPVVLRCGVTPLPPTPSACIGVDDIDWVFTETGADYVFTTYGRLPATEVSLPSSSVPRAQAPSQLTDLTAAIKPVPQSRHCDSEA